MLVAMVTTLEDFGKKSDKSHENGIFHPSVVSKCGFLSLHCVIIKQAHTIFNENNAS